ncbi:hypothetical protein K2X33_06785 [bacterium]|nr:hypothetical protein [bacterium]
MRTRKAIFFFLGVLGLCSALTLRGRVGFQHASYQPPEPTTEYDRLKAAEVERQAIRQLIYH